MDGSDARRRVVVEGVQPEIDCGRFAIKRITGDRVTVEADVFADGHDALTSVLAWRREPSAVQFFPVKTVTLRAFEGDVIAVRTKMGRRLVTTPDHPFATRQGVKLADGAENKAFFGSPGTSSDYAGIFKMAQQMYQELGVLRSAASDPESSVDRKILASIK